MPKRPYREHHIISLAEAYEQQHLPLDLFMNHYFRQNKALGPKDRGVIADTIYGITRWRGLIDFLCQEPATWDKRLDCYANLDIQAQLTNPDIPRHVLYSFPKYLYDLIAASHGEKKAEELCLISNGTAPTTVRINPGKTTRAAMLDRWKNTYSISPTPQAANGIIFHKKINFFTLPEFLEGLFEVQDEGSQLLSALMAVEPGQQVMDYCSGSGGKTLAFAHRMQGKGQIFLHDIRKHTLVEARKRLKRAGIQNAQILSEADDAKLKKLKKKMDWVLVDAPCSGTGTLRRNPDMKWKFDEATLTKLIGQQRMIFEKALSFLKPGGRIVYSTCSILKEENGEQVKHFMKTYGLKLEGDFFHILPSENSMDGFFGAIMIKA